MLNMFSGLRMHDQSTDMLDIIEFGLRRLMLTIEIRLIEWPGLYVQSRAETARATLSVENVIFMNQAMPG